MKFWIIVKGNGETIFESVIRRGIRVLEYHNVSPCMTALIEVENTETLIRWYEESGKEPPFPEGSLLYWSPREEEKKEEKKQEPGTERPEPLVVSVVSGFVDHFKDVYDFVRLEIKECLEENRRSDVSLIKKFGNAGVIALHAFLFPFFVGFWIGLIGLLIATFLSVLASVLALLFGVDQHGMPEWMRSMIELSRRK